MAYAASVRTQWGVVVSPDEEGCAVIGRCEVEGEGMAFSRGDGSGGAGSFACFTEGHKLDPARIDFLGGFAIAFRIALEGSIVVIFRCLDDFARDVCEPKTACFCYQSWRLRVDAVA